MLPAYTVSIVPSWYTWESTFREAN